jgi:hypothetical protein
VCGILRVALLRTSLPDVRLSDLQDPARMPLVLAFRDEVSRVVRPAEFSDLQGLIQRLSTGIQAALDKLDKQAKRDNRDEQPTGPGAAGLVLRLAPRPVFLAGREELLTGLEARIANYLGRSGSYAAARDLFAALLPVDERVLGPQHPHTLTARHQFTYWTERAERGPTVA